MLNQHCDLPLCKAEGRVPSRGPDSLRGTVLEQIQQIVMQAEGKGEQQMLVPTVLWAQRKNMVLLRVQIQPLEVSAKRSYGVYVCDGGVPYRL